MIKKKVLIDGRPIMVCKVSHKGEMISSLPSRIRPSSDRTAYFICALANAKTRFELELLKVKLKLENL